MATPEFQSPESRSELVRAIAGEVVALVRSELGIPAGEEWVDAKEIARRFHLSRAWVYAHSGELGGVRIGDGPRPRVRFMPSVVAEALRAKAERPAVVEGETPSASAVPIHVPRVRRARHH